MSAIKSDSGFLKKPTRARQSVYREVGTRHSHCQQSVYGFNRSGAWFTNSTRVLCSWSVNLYHENMRARRASCLKMQPTYHRSHTMGPDSRMMVFASLCTMCTSAHKNSRMCMWLQLNSGRTCVTHLTGKTWAGVTLQAMSVRRQCTRTQAFIMTNAHTFVQDTCNVRHVSIPIHAHTHEHMQTYIFTNTHIHTRMTSHRK